MAVEWVKGLRSSERVQVEETISREAKTSLCWGSWGVLVAGSTPLSSQVLGFRNYWWETPVWPVFALGGILMTSAYVLTVIHFWENSVVQMNNHKVVTQTGVWSWSVLGDQPTSLPRKPPF